MPKHPSRRSLGNIGQQELARDVINLAGPRHLEGLGQTSLRGPGPACFLLHAYKSWIRPRGTRTGRIQKGASSGTNQAPQSVPLPVSRHLTKRNMSIAALARASRALARPRFIGSLPSRQASSTAEKAKDAASSAQKGAASATASAQKYAQSAYDFGTKVAGNVGGRAQGLLGCK